MFICLRIIDFFCALSLFIFCWLANFIINTFNRQFFILIYKQLIHKVLVLIMWITILIMWITRNFSNKICNILFRFCINCYKNENKAVENLIMYKIKIYVLLFRRRISRVCLKCWKQKICQKKCIIQLVQKLWITVAQLSTY